jgi:hypothetical protein
MGGKPVKLSTIIIVVAILYLIGDATSGGSSGGSTPKNPHPVSTVCNKYFRGGC